MSDLKERVAKFDIRAKLKGEGYNSSSIVLSVKQAEFMLGVLDEWEGAQASLDNAAKAIENGEAREAHWREKYTELVKAAREAIWHLVGDKPEIESPKGNRMQAAMAVLNIALEDTDGK